MCFQVRKQSILHERKQSIVCWKVVQLGCRTLRIFQRPKQLRNFSDRPWRSIHRKSFSIGHIRYLTSASSRSGCLRICPASMLSPLHRATWAKTSTPGQDMCHVTRQGRSKEVDTKPLWHEWMLSELKCVVLHSYYTTVVQVGSSLPSGSHCFSPQFLMLNPWWISAQPAWILQHFSPTLGQAPSED